MTSRFFFFPFFLYEKLLIKKNKKQINAETKRTTRLPVPVHTNAPHTYVPHEHVHAQTERRHPHVRRRFESSSCALHFTSTFLDTAGRRCAAAVRSDSVEKVFKFVFFFFQRTGALREPHFGVTKNQQATTTQRNGEGVLATRGVTHVLPPSVSVHSPGELRRSSYSLESRALRRAHVLREAQDLCTTRLFLRLRVSIGVQGM